MTPRRRGPHHGSRAAAIRGFRSDDLDTVKALWSALHRHVHARSANRLYQADPAALDDELARRFACILSDDDHCGLLAETEDAAVGLATAFVKTTPWMAVKRVGCIAALWVEPGHRRAGIGQSLLADLESWFAIRTVSHVTLTWMTQNLEAERFWRSAGYALQAQTAGKALS